MEKNLIVDFFNALLQEELEKKIITLISRNTDDKEILKELMSYIVKDG